MRWLLIGLGGIAVVIVALVMFNRVMPSSNRTASTGTTISAADAFAKASDAFTAKDYVKAMHWYRISAAGGNGEADNFIGVFYDVGLGVPVNPAEAVRWYRLGAARGNSTSQYSLAQHFEAGLGVAKDMTQARDWMTKAAAGGNYDARQWLGQHPQ